MTRLLLVRHAVTVNNKTNRFWGSTDLPLSDTGLRQAERLRDRLSKQPIDVMYSSLLSRSRSTAEIIASPRAIDISGVAELNECDFGEAEGLNFDEISVRFPHLAEALLGNDIDTAFPGGECLQEVFNRVGNFKKKLETHAEAETICIVGHGASLQTLICHLLGIPAIHWRQFRIERGSVSIIETYPGGAVMTSMNDTCHLEGIN